jgi:hypothetical protein
VDCRRFVPPSPCRRRGGAAPQSGCARASTAFRRWRGAVAWSTGRARAIPKVFRRSRSSRAIRRDSVTGRSAREAGAACPAREFLDPALEPGECGQRDAPPRLLPGREAESEELAPARQVDRALRCIDPELEAPGEELFEARHHSLAGAAAADVDVAVVGIAHEAMAAPPQFAVHHIQHQVRQQRRERPALRHPRPSGRPTRPPARPRSEK